MTEVSTIFLAIEKPGGLFDFDGTLPLVVVQFLVLMFLLNLILYTPLLNIISDRNQYISKNLVDASNILSQSDLLIKQYESEVTKARKEAQIELTELQKLSTDLLAREKYTTIKVLDDYIKDTMESFKTLQKETQESLEGEIDSLSGAILLKILA